MEVRVHLPDRLERRWHRHAHHIVGLPAEFTACRCRTDWYRNLQADPRARIVLPGRAIAARGEMIDDADERARACHAVLRAAGLPGLAFRTDVIGVDEATFRARTAEDRVVRFRVPDLRAGPFDPGGLGWLAVWVAPLALLALLRRHGAGRKPPA